MNDSGFVYIVGAGPGDPDLITVKGLRCLRQSDIVLHDRLVDRRLLEEIRPDAKVIDVGKRKGTEDVQQTRINILMVEYALAGNIVCRLKGGDPFVFGRAAEEIEALNAAGVHFEVVPGVSSVTAAASSAGVSLTERLKSHAFMVIAGSRSLEFESAEWRAARTLLATGGSVAVLMGLSRIRAIAQWLMNNGCDADLPATVVSRATWSDQQVRSATLGTISAEAGGLTSPAILFIGQFIGAQGSPLPEMHAPALEGVNEYRSRDLATKLPS